MRRLLTAISVMQHVANSRRLMNICNARPARLEIILL